MEKLKREDLFSLEKYAQIRALFRAKVIEHKKNRSVQIGAHASLYFEDRLTMHYQVQEMLRAERIFEPAAIAEELEAYNPLIPDGRNWKATFMLEYDDIDERRQALISLKGAEDRVWIKVNGFEPVYAIADEDLKRDDGTKTSAVHFLRFELSTSMVAAVKSGTGIAVGIDHPAYDHKVDPLASAVRDALAHDLQN